MNPENLVRTYHNALSVWVLLKAPSGFERAVPPGCAVTFFLSVEEKLEVMPLMQGNGVFGIQFSEEATCL